MELEEELEKVERDYKTAPSRVLQRQLSALKGKIKAIYTNRAEYTLLRLRQICYAQGGKVGTHLLRQLREKRERESSVFPIV